MHGVSCSRARSTRPETQFWVCFLHGSWAGVIWKIQTISFCCVVQLPTSGCRWNICTIPLFDWNSSYVWDGRNSRAFCVFLYLFFLFPVPLLSTYLHISWDTWKGIHNFIILLAGLLLLLVRKGKREDFTLVFICKGQGYWLQQLHLPVFSLSWLWESFSLVRLKSFGVPLFTWASHCFLICEVLAAAI